MCWRAFLLIGTWGQRYRGDFFGAFIAFFFSLIISLSLNMSSWVILSTWLSPAVFVPLILLVITGTPLLIGWNRVFISFERRFMQTRFKYPTIQILNGFAFDGKNETKTPLGYTDFDVNAWEEKLKTNKNYSIALIPSSKINSKFSMIINPFGEHYPEEDEPNHATLNRIRGYIQNGGVFVNVSGFPFFWTWNTTFEPAPRMSGNSEQVYKLTKRGNEVYAIPEIELLSASLRDTWLHKTFGIQCNLFGDSEKVVFPVDDTYFHDLVKSDGTVTVREFRSAVRSERSDIPLIPLLRSFSTITIHVEGEKEDKVVNFPCYPISVVKYGLGYLVIVGMHLMKSRPQDFTLVIESLRKIVEKLSKKGDLSS